MDEPEYEIVRLRVRLERIALCVRRYAEKRGTEHADEAFETLVESVTGLFPEDADTRGYGWSARRNYQKSRARMGRDATTVDRSYDGPGATE